MELLTPNPTTDQQANFFGFGGGGLSGADTGINGYGSYEGAARFNNEIAVSYTHLTLPTKRIV